MKIISGIFLLLFTACVFAKNTIVILGDSLSAGFGVAAHQEWPALLEQRLKDKKYDYEVINESVSGETLSWGLQHLPDVITKYDPGIIIIELGTNDGLLNSPIPLIKKNLHQLIKIAKGAHRQVLLLGVHLPLGNSEAYRENFRKLFSNIARQERIRFVPHFLRNLEGDSDLKQPDGLHPTTKAQIILLDTAWPMIEIMLNKPH